MYDDKNFIAVFFTRLKGFSNNIKYYLLGVFFLQFGVSVMFLMFNLYLKEAGYNEAFIGRVISMNSLGGTLLIIPAVIIYHTFSTRRILMISTFLLMVVTFFQVVILDPISIMFFALLIGALSTFIYFVNAPFLMLNTKKEDQSYAFSLSFSLFIIASFISNIAAGYFSNFLLKGIGLSELLSYRYTILCASLFSIFGIFQFMKLKEHGDKGKLKIIKLKDLNLLLKFFKITFPYFIIALGASLFVPFMNLYFKELFSCSGKEIGVIFAILQIFMIIGTLSGPGLSEKIGKVKLIYLTQFLSIPFMMVLGFNRMFYLVTVSFFLRATLMNMAHPIMTNFAMNYVGKEFHSSLNVLLMITWTVPWMIGASIGGMIIDRYGFSYSIVFSAILYFVANFMFFMFFRKKEERHEYKMNE